MHHILKEICTILSNPGSPPGGTFWQACYILLPLKHTDPTSMTTICQTVVKQLTAHTWASERTCPGVSLKEMLQIKVIDDYVKHTSKLSEGCHPLHYELGKWMYVVPWLSTEFSPWLLYPDCYCLEGGAIHIVSRYSPGFVQRDDSWKNKLITWDTFSVFIVKTTKHMKRLEASLMEEAHFYFFGSMKLVTWAITGTTNSEDFLAESCTPLWEECCVLLMTEHTPLTFLTHAWSSALSLSTCHCQEHPLEWLSLPRPSLLALGLPLATGSLLSQREGKPGTQTSRENPPPMTRKVWQISSSSPLPLVD